MSEREREVRESVCERETQSCKYRHCLELGPDCSAAVERETEKQRERERLNVEELVVQEDEEATPREEGEKQSVELVIQCGRYVHCF